MPGKDLTTLMADIKQSLEHLVTLEIVTAVGGIERDVTIMVLISTMTKIQR